MSNIWGVIGCGTVGTAIAEGLERNRSTWWAYDIESKKDKVYSRKNINVLQVDVVQKTNAIFIALPTPASASRSEPSGYDLTAVVKTLLWLKRVQFTGTAILVSTIGVGDLTRIYSQLNGCPFTLVMSPENLTANRAGKEWFYGDVVYSSHQTCAHQVIKDAAAASRSQYSKVKRLPVSELELVKTWTNVALATKLLVANSIYLEAMSITGMTSENAQEIVHQVFSDPRLKTAQAYHTVGNHEGTLGFAGACLPKDLKAKANSHRSPVVAEWLQSMSDLNDFLKQVKLSYVNNGCLAFINSDEYNDL